MPLSFFQTFPYTSPCSLSDLGPFEIPSMLYYFLLDKLKCERNKETMPLSYVLYHAFAKMNIISPPTLPGPVICHNSNKGDL